MSSFTCDPMRAARCPVTHINGVQVKNWLTMREHGGSCGTVRTYILDIGSAEMEVVQQPIGVA